MGLVRDFFTGLLSGVIASMPACDSLVLPKLKPGVTRTQEVEALMGPPTLTWRDPDGTQTWEYPRTPNGVVNYMLDFGPDDVLRAVRQVLTEENFARVQPGMTREAVRRLLGQPAHEYDFALKHEDVWDWRQQDVSGSDVFFNVHFSPDGRVTHTSRNLAPTR